jgi:hypothetical protein
MMPSLACTLKVALKVVRHFVADLPRGNGIETCSVNGEYVQSINVATVPCGE